MSELPTRTDRMPVGMRKPRSGPLLDPDEVIANCLNYSMAFDWSPPVKPNSTPVKAVLDGLRMAGYKIVPL